MLIAPWTEISMLLKKFHGCQKPKALCTREFAVQARRSRIIKRFDCDGGKFLCLCGPPGDAEGIEFQLVGDDMEMEVGVLKEVVNLLKEGDNEKLARSNDQY